MKALCSILLVGLVVLTAALYAEDAIEVDPQLLRELPDPWAELITEVPDDDNAAVFWAGWHDHMDSTTDQTIIHDLYQVSLFWGDDELKKLGPWLAQQLWVFDFIDEGLQRPGLSFVPWDAHRGAERANRVTMSEITMVLEAHAHWAMAHNDPVRLRQAVTAITHLASRIRETPPTTTLDMLNKVSVNASLIAAVLDLEQRQPLPADLRRLIIQSWRKPSLWESSPWTPVRMGVLGDLRGLGGGGQRAQAVDDMVNRHTEAAALLQREGYEAQQAQFAELHAHLQHLQGQLAATPVDDERPFFLQRLQAWGQLIDHFAGQARPPLSIDQLLQQPQWSDTVAVARLVTSGQRMVFTTGMLQAAGSHDAEGFLDPLPEWDRSHVAAWLQQPAPRARFLTIYEADVMIRSGLRRPHRTLIMERLALLRMVSLLHPSDAPLSHEHLEKALAAEGLPLHLLKEPWSHRPLLLDGSVIAPQDSEITSDDDARWLWGSSDPWLRLDGTLDATAP